MLHAIEIHAKALDWNSNNRLSFIVNTDWRQIQYWENSTKLFVHTLEITKNNYLIYNNLGIALDRNGNMTDAITCFEQAVRINPHYFNARVNLGVDYERSGRFDDATKQSANAPDRTFESE